uniref:MobA/MobL family protein n=1 Tax=Staphylococcus hominis TaxID=1290 RepID=UPI001642F697
THLQTQLTKHFIKTHFLRKPILPHISIHTHHINNPHPHLLPTQTPFNPHPTSPKNTKTTTQYHQNPNPIVNKNPN